MTRKTMNQWLTGFRSGSQSLRSRLLEAHYRRLAMIAAPLPAPVGWTTAAACLVWREKTERSSLAPYGTTSFSRLEGASQIVQYGSIARRFLVVFGQYAEQKFRRSALYTSKECHEFAWQRMRISYPNRAPTRRRDAVCRQ